jgi:hypothetical protein
MTSSPLRPELVEKLRARMAELTDSDERWVAERFDALPLCGDMGGCLALRVDGEVLAVGSDEAEGARVERLERIRNAALFQGSRRYPELAELVPLRPEGARTCPDCGGTGVGKVAREIGAANVVCYCAGWGG